MKTDTAKLFKNGQSQAVRLPKAFRMPGKEVKISKDGNRVILEPVTMSCAEWLKILDQFPTDFKMERNQPALPPNRVFFDKIPLQKGTRRERDK